MVKRVNFDITKLKSDDRRFLMNRSLNIVSTNATSQLVNTSLLISSFSTIVAIFALVFSLLKLFNKLFIVVILVLFFIFLIFMIIWYILAQKTLKKETQGAREGHDMLFRKHFEYAIKK